MNVITVFSKIFNYCHYSPENIYLLLCLKGHFTPGPFKTEDEIEKMTLFTEFVEYLNMDGLYIIGLLETERIAAASNLTSGLWKCS
jgi:hypothetical protein